MIKMVRSVAILAFQVCYYQLKNQQFKDNKTTTILNCHIFLFDQLDAHVSTKIATYRVYKGVLGGLKKSNKMEAFPLLIFLFWAEIPKSPKQ